MQNAQSSSKVSMGGKISQKHKRGPLRAAGGEVWQDPTLLEWDSNDYRVFCGNLGPEVDDKLLAESFSQYKSLLKAKVVKDSKTSYSKGFGFVSFKDPKDFIKAMREMQAVAAVAPFAWAGSQVKMFYQGTGNQCSNSQMLKYVSMPTTEECSFTSTACDTSLTDGMYSKYSCFDDKLIGFPANAQTRFMQIRYFTDDQCSAGKKVAVGTAMDKCQPMPSGTAYQSFRLSGDATKLTITVCEDDSCLSGCKGETLKMYPNKAHGNCTTDASAIGAFYYMVPNEALDYLTFSEIKAAFVQILDQNGNPISS